MTHTSYDLSDSHRVRYFTIQDNPQAVVKAMNRWLKNNKTNLEILNIDINGTFNELTEEDEWSAVVVYLGFPIED